jgi:subtilisin family serine protease
LGAAGSERAYALAETYKSDQVIVKLTDNGTIEDIFNSYPGTEPLDDYFASKRIYLLSLPPDWVGTEETFANTLETDLSTVVEYAEPNFVADTPENDTVGDGRHRAWGISSTSEDRTPSDRNATESLRLGCAARITQGNGITVAVLDTGAQLGHPALKANFEGVPRRDFVDDDANPSEKLDADRDGVRDRMAGHGTHVAGIVDRVAPGAKIMPLRVLNSKGYGDTYTIAKAVAYAQRYEADVINLSLGSSRRSSMLQEIIRGVINRGIVVVAAAGNSNDDAPHYPAAGDYPDPNSDPIDIGNPPDVGPDPSGAGLLAVTSVDRFDEKSSFANYGIWVDIATPGNGIRSAFPTFEGAEYANWSGTSMATPFVSGQAALIRKYYGRNQLDPAAIEDKIRKTGRDIILSNAEHTGWTAYRADVCASIKG